jgi:hypothetical protein
MYRSGEGCERRKETHTQKKLYAADDDATS